MFFRSKRGFLIALLLALTPALVFGNPAERAQNLDFVYEINENSFRQIDHYFLGDDSQTHRKAEYRDYTDIRNYLVEQNPQTLKAASKRSSKEFIQWLETASEPILYITREGHPAIFHDGKINIWTGVQVNQAIQTNRPPNSMFYDPKKADEGNQSKSIHHDEKFYIFVSTEPPPRVHRYFEKAGLNREDLTFLYMVPSNLDHDIGKKIPLFTVPLPTAISKKFGIKTEDLLEAEIDYVRLNQTAQPEERRSPGLYIRLEGKKPLFIPVLELKKAYTAVESLWLVNLLQSNHVHDDKLRSLFDSLEEDLIHYVRECVGHVEKVAPWAKGFFLDLLNEETFVPQNGVATNTRLRANGPTSTVVRSVIRKLPALESQSQKVTKTLNRSLNALKKNQRRKDPESTKTRQKRIHRYLAALSTLPHHHVVQKSYHTLQSMASAMDPKARNKKKMSKMTPEKRSNFLRKKLKWKKAFKRSIGFAKIALLGVPSAIVLPYAIPYFTEHGAAITLNIGSVLAASTATVMTFVLLNRNANRTLSKHRELRLKAADQRNDDGSGLEPHEEESFKKLSKKVEKLAKRGRTEQLTTLEYFTTQLAPKYWFLTAGNWVRWGMKLGFPRYIPTRQAGGKANWADGGLRPVGFDALYKVLLTPFRKDVSQDWALKMARRQALIERNRMIETATGNALLRLQIQKALDLGLSTAEIISILNVHRRTTVKIKLSDLSIDKERQRQLQDFVGDIFSIARTSELEEELLTFMSNMDEDLSFEERIVQLERFAEERISEINSDPVQKQTRTRLAKKVNLILWDLHHSFHRFGNDVENAYHPGDRTSSVKKFKMHLHDNYLSRIVLAQSAVQMGLKNWSPNMTPQEFFDGSLLVSFDLTLSSATNLSQGVTANGKILDRLYEPASTKENYWLAFYRSHRRIHYKQIMLQSASWIDLRFWQGLVNSMLIGGMMVPIDGIMTMSQLKDVSFVAFWEVFQQKLARRGLSTASFVMAGMPSLLLWVPAWRFYMAGRLSARGGYDTAVYDRQGKVDKEKTLARSRSDRLNYVYFIFAANFALASYFGFMMPKMTDFLQWTTGMSPDALNNLLSDGALEEAGLPSPEDFEQSLATDRDATLESLLAHQTTEATPPSEDAIEQLANKACENSVSGLAAGQD